jgi:hypothetical protein
MHKAKYESKSGGSQSKSVNRIYRGDHQDNQDMIHHGFEEDKNKLK